MEIMLGSIRSYFYERNMVDVYTRELPKEVETPFMFFPQPSITDDAFTKLSYENSYVLRARIFEDESAIALAIAEDIAQDLRKSMHKLPLINEDGTPTGDILELDKIETELVIRGIAQVSLYWKTIHNYN